MPVYEPIQPKVNVDWNNDAIFAAWQNLPYHFADGDVIVTAIRKALNAAVEAQLKGKSIVTTQELREALDVNKISN